MYSIPQVRTRRTLLHQREYKVPSGCTTCDVRAGHHLLCSQLSTITLSGAQPPSWQLPVSMTRLAAVVYPQIAMAADRFSRLRVLHGRILHQLLCRTACEVFGLAVCFHHSSRQLGRAAGSRASTAGDLKLQGRAGELEMSAITGCDHRSVQL